eukprot:5188588-Pyramimonas_sp.AAC.1
MAAVMFRVLWFLTFRQEGLDGRIHFIGEDPAVEHVTHDIPENLGALLVRGPGEVRQTVKAWRSGRRAPGKLLERLVVWRP